MTVAELTAELAKVPPDAMVVVTFDSGLGSSAVTGVRVEDEDGHYIKVGDVVIESD